MDIEKANAETVGRMMEARPVLVGGPGARRDPWYARQLVDARRPTHHLGSDVRADARSGDGGFDL